MDTIEYYDYDGDGEQGTRDALVNEVPNGGARLSADDKGKIKRGKDERDAQKVERNTVAMIVRWQRNY